MKSLNLSLVLLFTINTEGQIEKPFTSGNLIVGGSVRANGMKIEVTSPSLTGDLHYSENKFNCDLLFGFFVSNYIATGVKADISLFRTKYESGSTTYSNDLLFEPFMRFYIPIGLFGEVSYGFGNYKIGVSNTADSNERKRNVWCIGLGYSLLISKHIAIEPLIAYEGRRHFQIEDETTYRYNGVNAQVGVHVYLDILNKKP